LPEQTIIELTQTAATQFDATPTAVAQAEFAQIPATPAGAVPIHTAPGATQPIDLTGWTCPAPLRDQPRVVMGHGGGGAMSAELLRHVFAPAYGNAVLAQLTDAAAISLGGVRLAFSTDSFVVRPLFFPGGSIGDLAVNGTVNDLAMSGARAAYLSCGFILEEGVEMTVLNRVAEALGAAARAARVEVATGDTKVVEAGHGDGIYINTAGIGVIPDGVDLRPQRVVPGDVVIVSGAIGVHGVAVMSVREGLEFEVEVESDCAPLGDLVDTMLAAGKDIHVLRDPTRGGLAAALHEIATAAGVGVLVNERSIPVPAPVANACAILGLDPMYVANEGKLVAFVPPEHADAVLEAMRSHPLGADACVIGRAVDEHPGMVVARTALGGTRIVDLPVGEQLPRIC
jgi:hydrogenase expression/formation protein HypE